MASGRSRSQAWLLVAALCCVGSLVSSTHAAPAAVGSEAERWSRQVGFVRGVTLGPIESALHPEQGYGSELCGRALDEAQRMGAGWVSLTPFGRVWDLAPGGIALDFEASFAQNRRNVLAAVKQAHALGLRVLLVPHLWVETGGWRGEIDPGTPEGWAQWARAYEGFVLQWARVANEAQVDMLAVGIELGSWLTSTHASSFLPIIEKIRRRYSGLLTYAGNWDDIERTVILGELDAIGVNAFYPLAEHEGAGWEELLAGGESVAERVKALALTWQKPVLFTEFGYTNRTDPALRPWEWPEHLQAVRVDQQAQASAYLALLAPLIEEPWFAGFFAWRLFSNPEDVSQEAEWGFSPRGKQAELVLRDALAAHWAMDGARPRGAGSWLWATERIATY